SARRWRGCWPTTGRWCGSARWAPTRRSTWRPTRWSRRSEAAGRRSSPRPATARGPRSAAATRARPSTVERRQPIDGPGQHLGSLAARDPHERSTGLLVVVEDGVRDGHHAGALRELPAELDAIGLTQRSDVGGDEVGAVRAEDLEPSVGQPRRQLVAAG